MAGPVTAGWALHPKLGTRLGARFEIEGEVAQGGMGTVYRARDLRDGAIVAVKVLRVLEAEDAERFAREVAVLRELSHPNIVRLIADGRAVAGVHYLVEEWVDGQSLRSRLGAGGLTAAESVAVVRASAAALAEVHARGIVHRDVKPENLIFPRDAPSAVKVVDFGLARRLDDRFTRTGTIVGTPAYMAPEQARGDRDLDARVDVFALGCVLYECLTGRAPFSGRGLTSLCCQLLLSDPPAAEELCEDLPPGLAAALRRMLARSRDLRLNDAAEVVQALAGLEPPPLRRRPGSGVEERTLVAGSSPPGITASPGIVFLVLASLDADAGDECGPSGPLAAAADGVWDLGRGEVAAVLVEGPSAPELTGRAAACALGLRARRPGATVVLAAGRAAPDRPMRLTDDLFERAAAALQEKLAGGPGIRLDRVAAELLADRFAIRWDGEVPHLVDDLPPA